MSKGIRLWQPIGGEKWGVGKDEKIAWLSEHVSGNIKLDLFKKDKYVGNIARDVPVEKCEWSWKVGDYRGGKAKPASDYRIRISTMDGKFEDESNYTFTIQVDLGRYRKPKITTPTGRETWHLGEVQKITWDSKQVGAKVNLVLLKNREIVGTIAENLPINAGTFEWKVGRYRDKSGRLVKTGPGTGYTIRISTVNGAFFDDIPLPIKLQPRPTTVCGPVPYPVPQVPHRVTELRQAGAFGSESLAHPGSLVPPMRLSNRPVLEQAGKKLAGIVRTGELSRIGGRRT